MSEPKKILAIVAHPDDCEFTSSGTIAKWIEEGYVVEYVLCTSGNKGTSDPQMTPERLAATREQEQLDAAKELGVSHCIFLRHNDGEMEVTLKLREELSLVIRQRKPFAVLTHDPWKMYMIHPDHRAVGFSALDAVAAARDHLYFPHQLSDGLSAQRVKEVYLFNPQEPNYWVDITDTFDKKIASIAQHRSQVSQVEEMRSRIREMAAAAGQPKNIQLAETFHRIELR